LEDEDDVGRRAEDEVDSACGDDMADIGVGGGDDMADIGVGGDDGRSSEGEET
jgi:hypothetical protein